MKLRNIRNFPVFYKDEAAILGRVKRVIVNDDYEIDCLIIDTTKQGQQIAPAKAITLGKNTVMLNNLEAMKPYSLEETLTVYEEKLGDVIFDQEGRELGMVSDLVVDRPSLKIIGIEVTAGLLRDLIDGRIVIPLEQVIWSGKTSAVLNRQMPGDSTSTKGGR